MERESKRYAKLLEHIPEEIMFEVFTRSPVKSLLKFRCVCKSWKSLISSPNFINAHLERQVMNSSSDYVLVGNPSSTKSLYSAKTSVKYMNLDITRCWEMSFSCDDFCVYGSCNGLLCFSANNELYIWNPSIRKTKRLPQGRYQNRNNLIRFGFHREENDYKVVMIDLQAKDKFIVEVYSLKMNAWRSVDAVLPFSVGSINRWGIHVKGVVYWIVRAENNAKFSLLCFDMNNEVFRSMELPDIDKLAFNSVDIRVFEKSLSLLHLRQGDQVAGNVACCDIWVRGQDTWKMTRTIRVPQVNQRYSLHNRRKEWTLSITKHGVYIASPNNDRDFKTLFLYDPISQEAREISRIEPYDIVWVDTYIENLGLLD